LRRRLPRWSELRDLVQIEPPKFGDEARVSRAASVGDLRRIARRRTPRAVFDYVDGAAGPDETALNRAREAFRRVELIPEVLRDVTTVDTSTTILGRPSALPLAFAPTGFTRAMGTEGEVAVGKVARRIGIPHALSTMGTTSIERLVEEVGDADRWFQLYVWRDRGASQALVERAKAAGYRALVLTVDTHLAGRRLRDVRNGFTQPPAFTLKTFADMAIHPAWWFDMLTTEPLRFANLVDERGSVSDMVSRILDPALSFTDLEWLRGIWDGPLVVKGVMTPQGATAVVDRGADAVIVSNHGGRQLIHAPTPLEQLPGIVDAVGDRAEIMLDGGILDGGDIVAAVAMGAKACLVARAYLYGLMAGGEAGVQKAADLLSAGIVNTMGLMGITSIDQLTPEHVRMRSA
jgi:L-lactate dehydrogenase (cytochrome)